MQIENYLSLWIGNLGVVPLFSLAFFLFLPALLSFNFLLVRVCIVLEPINVSLSYRINNKLRVKFLSFSSQVVKVFVLVCAAQSSRAATEVFLAKGEQTEIQAKSLKSFSVGNHEVLKYKYRPSKSTILVKGKSLGFSDLVIWKGENQKETFHIYVTSKKDQLQQMQLLKSLEQTKLKTSVQGEFISLTGEASEMTEYQILKKIQASKLSNIIINVQIAKQLQNQIVANIYTTLYDQGVKYVTCHFQQIDVFCQYNDPFGQANIKLIQEKYFVHFSRQVSQNLYDNYELKFQIISLETTTLEDYSLGIKEIQFSLQEAVKNNQINLNSGNFLIDNDKYSARMLANPQINTIVNQKFTVTLGSEVPFQRAVNEQTVTEWKFAGLKLSGKIEILNGKLALNLETQITAAEDEQISGPSGSAISYITPDISQLIYSISLDSKNQKEDHLPILEKIPILQKIFTSETTYYTNKKILCYVTMRKINHDN